MTASFINFPEQQATATLFYQPAIDYFGNPD
jgi:hypothetical protein